MGQERHPKILFVISFQGNRGSDFKNKVCFYTDPFARKLDSTRQVPLLYR